jgi:hypothetical protein
MLLCCGIPDSNGHAMMKERDAKLKYLENAIG